MFTKKIIEDILKENKQKKFVIKTSIARGRGINGVEYLEFNEVVKYCNGSTLERKHNSHIDTITENYIKITTSKYNFISNKMFEKIVHYIPLELITSVCFIDDMND